MIRVERPQTSPIPPGLGGMVRASASARYQLAPEVRHRSKFEFEERQQIVQLVQPSLNDVFRGKCAYCESLTGSTEKGEIDWFRPYSDASDLSGVGSPDHYCWLAAEWENLYLACRACLRAKRSFFPVEGNRAALMAPIELIRRQEYTLLADPCFDRPDDHLKFVQDGTVQPRSSKGDATIKTFNLNRPELVRARFNIWQRVIAEAGNEPVQGQLDSMSRRMLASDMPHIAATRAALAHARQLLSPRSFPEPRQEVRSVEIEKRSAEEILANDAEAFRLTARPIRRVKIENFRALRDISIQFGEPGSERAPWLMLLGENATGKSSILQAIALALAGGNEARRRVSPKKLLSTGAFSGSIKVWFWDQDEPAELRFRRNFNHFEGTHGPSAIVLGYGALRYSERRTRDYDGTPRFTRIVPLLRPIAGIRYPADWLLRLDDKRFDTAARALQSVLPAGAGGMERIGRNLLFEVQGHRALLSELSAGYQTIIGICADLMQLLFERWDTLSSATAIVLIDEIDAHLHPRWAMRIVGALRDAFPQVQFIASTHDPLTLRGLRDGEVMLLRRDEEGRLVADQNLPPLEGMQVDQILTSRVFGLESTIDPETEKLLNEYFHLRSLPQEPTRTARIEAIRLQIGDRELLGRSESERLMLEAAEDFIRETATDFKKRQDLRPETIARLRKIAGASRRSRSDAE